MYSEGILFKAKIYIVLVQNLRNNKRERSGHLCLGKMFSPTGRKGLCGTPLRRPRMPLFTHTPNGSFSRLKKNYINIQRKK